MPPVAKALKPSFTSTISVEALGKEFFLKNKLYAVDQRTKNNALFNGQRAIRYTVCPGLITGMLEDTIYRH
jgi:hypothetical protein